MKKFIIFILILFLNCCFSFATEYNKSETMSFTEYLYCKKTKKDWKALKLNENGDVIFKEKVLLTNTGEPLNENTAYTTLELKILFAAERIKPRMFCNPKNTAKNGTLGCYVDNPDRKSQKLISVFQKNETITLNDFLHAKEAPDNWKHLGINKNGDVTYRNKVIIDESGRTINDTTASESYLLLKILLIAKGAEPKENCDTSDPKNGIYGLGCYVYEADE